MSGLHTRQSWRDARRFGATALAAILCHGFAQAQTLPAQPLQIVPGISPALAPTRDSAFAAYQRGYYRTALKLALKQLASNSNDAPAMALIGQIYADGLAVKINPAESARWMQLAAERGNREAEFSTGMDYLEGKGVAKDVVTARQWLEKAASAGHAGAQYNLAILAIAGKDDKIDDPDFVAAAKLFTQSAQGGDADAALSLGILYRQGRGVLQSDIAATQWFAIAAQRGNTPGMVEYAIALFKGIGTKKDETAAARLLLKAASRNNPIAQNRIARLLAAGRGIDKDMVQAMKWHVLARAAGEKDAWLDDRLKELSLTQQRSVSAAVRAYAGR